VAVTRVKICGLTHPEDVHLCAEAGADALGFVVEYPVQMPWVIDRRRACELMREVPPFVTRVAVVGGEVDELLRIADAVEPDALQLHRDEPEETVAVLRERLPGMRLIKALRVDVDAASNGAAAEWIEQARRFVAAGADAILLDAKTADRPAATGRAIDWGLASEVAAHVDAPVVLAGGLGPENVGNAVRHVRPYAVDVITSLEDEQHRKVPERVRAFVRAATAL
jgi:phosphoribosylanthranilate isomerase